MKFLRDKRGDTATEWLVVGATLAPALRASASAGVAIAVVGVMIWNVVQSASAQGGNVQTWIGTINVPASV